MEHIPETQVMSEGMEQNNNNSRNVSRKRLVRKRSFLDALTEKYCVNMNDDNYEFVHIVITGKPRNNGTDAELAHLRNVVLDRHNISHAGLPQEGLTSICPNVVDLDLACNNIDNWSEILQIISKLPKLKFVNLSGNKLMKDEALLRDWPHQLPAVENLVLNKTGITWTEVEALGQRLPSLRELHVCGNDFEDLECEWKHFSKVECLRLNNNTIKSWSEVWKLRTLTNLKNLILSGNPLQDVHYEPSCQGNQPGDLKPNMTPMQDCSAIIDVLVSEACQSGDNSVNEKCWSIVDEIFNEACNIACESCNAQTKETDPSNMFKSKKNCTPENSGKPIAKSDQMKGDNSEVPDSGGDDAREDGTRPFHQLHTLCLSKTNITDWEHLHALSQFPSLSSVRLTGIPLVAQMEQDDRWMLYIASLPNIKLLNGSDITNTEREKSERFFLRHFLNTAESDRPTRFAELEKKHGKLTQIVDIDLGARYEERPTLTFILCGKVAFKEKIHVVGPVGKLRNFVADKLGVHKRQFRMYHQSMIRTCIGELPDLEELFLDSLPMGRFDFLTGDEIHIDLFSFR
ncbi:tubulin-specific chaperone cofactor E-like protein [Haliotis cracherodii]|uniref:tubulin-specific chaperone cofactor E-like protein n=1 Tax=Haliotis cracherodii TaxID=6455 RepID=UPI0039ECA6B0